MNKVYYTGALILAVITVATAVWQKAPEGASMALAIVSAGFAIASVFHQK
mgnify:CR=1 FL=1